MAETYYEPTVLWRLISPDGADHSSSVEARATILPGNPTTLLWLVGDVLQRADNFADCGAALAGADRLRATLLEQGWKGKSEV